MPTSELKVRIEKYQDVVFDLAEISLFKLGKVNEALLYVSTYQSFLERHDLSDLWNSRRHRNLVYFLHTKMKESFRNPERVNLIADKYLDFQVEFTNFTKLLMKTAKKTSSFWTEMGKRDPHEPTILADLNQIERMNIKIKKIFARITENFVNSSLVVD